MSCHTDQTKYGFPEAKTTATGYDDTDKNGYKRVNGESAFTFPRMIHQTHMGSELLKTGYNLNAHAKKANGTTGCDATTNVNRGQCYNLVGFPQDARNCTTCHDGSAKKSDGSVNANKTTDGDNWMKVPSRLACGACHDGIDFATGQGKTLNGVLDAFGHIGGAQLDDKNCATCHTPAAIQVYHRTTVASLNNSIVKDGVASFVYKISSVTINASKQVVVKFQILKNGVAVALNPFAAGGVPLTGYTGGPTFQVAYATGQDGIAAPSDWNSGHDTLSLADAWAGANGNTLVGDATNTYTVTIAASSTGRYSSVHSLALPTDAKMVTALVAGSFIDPTVTERGGLLPGVPAMATATGNTPDGKPNVARRVVFSESKCNTCHDRLGTAPNFHDGNYSIAMCADLPYAEPGRQHGLVGLVPGLGARHPRRQQAQRALHLACGVGDGQLLHADVSGRAQGLRAMPPAGHLRFQRERSTRLSLMAGMLNVQTGTGKLNPASTTAYVFPQAAPVGSGQWAYGLKVDNTTDYGTGWSIDQTTGALVAATTQGNNLVTSPITAVCSTCHDGAPAIAHMENNGGSFYDARSVAVTRTEQCLVCHGNGKVADIGVVHKQ